NGDVLVALSTDGGASFTKVADLQTKFGDQPSIAVGPNSVWVSFTASPGKQIQAFGASVTGLGSFGTFTAPENVPSPGNGDYDDSTTNSQFNPAIALDQTSGNVAISWYDTRNDLGSGGSGDTDGIPNNDFQVWATDSANGGTTFAPNFQVSAGTSNAIDTGSFF